jgi:TatD DNase family protein
MHLIDSHCHLDFEAFDADRDRVLERARAAGVTRIVTPAYDPPSWRQVSDLAAAHPGVIFPALGLHPWVADQPIDLDDLADHLRGSKAVALGEVGLDGKVDTPAMAVQIAVLERQLELARDLDLPVILHCRGAFDELARILERFAPRLRGVLHAFSRPPELARRFLRLGLHLGIGGAVTRPTATRTHETVATVPLERLLLETDAPSIGLDGVDPAAAEPRHVADIARAIAERRGVEPAAVAAATTAAAEQLFDLTR